MTRQERKLENRKKILSYIESLKGKILTQKDKSKFRTTFVWNDFRDSMKKKYKVDALTGRKLTKTWNCHHRRSDSKLYTDLNEKYFLCLNNQQHDLYHIVYEEMLKNPDYLDNMKKLILEDIKTNKGESFIYKK